MIEGDNRVGSCPFFKVSEFSWCIKVYETYVNPIMSCWHGLPLLRRVFLSNRLGGRSRAGGFVTARRDFTLKHVTLLRIMAGRATAPRCVTASPICQDLPTGNFRVAPRNGHTICPAGSVPPYIRLVVASAITRTRRINRSGTQVADVECKIQVSRFRMRHLAGDRTSISNLAGTVHRETCPHQRTQRSELQPHAQRDYC